MKIHFGGSNLDPPHTFLIFWILWFWIRQNDRWIETKTLVCWKISQLTSIKFLEKKQSRNFLRFKPWPPPTLSRYFEYWGSEYGKMTAESRRKHWYVGTYHNLRVSNSSKQIVKNGENPFLRFKPWPPPHFLNISNIEVLNTAKCPQNQDENNGMSGLITTYAGEMLCENNS